MMYTNCCCIGKRSCVKKGYMKDDYIHLFVRRPVRRSPIINRGMIYSLQKYEYTIWAYQLFFCFVKNLVNFVAFVKVTFPVGLLSGSCSFSFLIVKEVQTTKVTQRNRYYQLELDSIRHFFSYRCVSFLGSCVISAH